MDAKLLRRWEVTAPNGQAGGGGSVDLRPQA